MLASRERRETSVALTSTLHWFETEVLAEERNYQGLARLNTDLVQHEAARPLARRLILDVDSSESPVHGAQEQAAYNGHFESVCYHPLFAFNQNGDCLAAALRPGNVHSGDGWEKILLPLVERSQARRQTVVVRAVHFYNQRGTAEQWIKEGKEATHWTRLSRHGFRANEVRLLLGVIAYNLGNLLRRLVLPLAIQSWSLTSLQQRLFKTGGRLIRHPRYFILQLAESHLTRHMFGQILGRIERLAWHPT
jgi:hypothetical protein